MSSVVAVTIYVDDGCRGQTGRKICKLTALTPCQMRLPDAMCNVGSLTNGSLHRSQQLRRQQIRQPVRSLCCFCFCRGSSISNCGCTKGIESGCHPQRLCRSFSSFILIQKICDLLLPATATRDNLLTTMCSMPSSSPKEHQIC